MLKLSPDGKNISKVWTQTKPDSQMGAAVLVKGHIYTSGPRGKKWSCLTWSGSV